MIHFPAGDSINRIKIRPFWNIIPQGEPLAQEGISLLLSAGTGFGTGAHETTQLCLQALGLMAPRERKVWSMLDFGSGSAILSIAAAKLGATIKAVEIDEEAIAHGEENARINEVSDRIQSSRTLEEVKGPFDLVVANILRPILLEYAAELTSRLAPGGTLLLSGLVGTDVPEVSVRFASYLNGEQPVVYQRGDWRALVWQSSKTALTNQFIDCRRSAPQF